MGENIKEIYLAGGCFWGVEGYFRKITGIVDTRTGYANGKFDNPTYEDICYRNSGHAETVYIRYDKNRIDLNEILRHYFRIIDPFSLNKQGNDRGTQYRTGIYYTDEESRNIAFEFIKEEQKKSEKKIMVELMPLTRFDSAEEYHQKYLDKNPGGYCHIDLSLASKPLVDEKKYTKPSKDELKKKFDWEQYHVTQENGTEHPFENEYYDNHKKGIYVDITTGEPLFVSDDKFDSGCGWPSFARPVAPEVVKYIRDTSYNMDRIEVRSRVGNAHLGHVFDDGPQNMGGLRYCINSASLRFIPVENMEEEGYEEFIKYVK